MNVHVVTFDYRGFGDSQCYPNETNIMEDGLLVWEWIKSQAPPSTKIYLWGHSLGSGVTTHLTLHLQSIGFTPDGIILDAPFTSIQEAAYNHPLGKPFVPLGMNYFRGMQEKHSSIERIVHITCPIMIIHGTGDHIIPFRLGKKLYEAALSARDIESQKQVIFIDCGYYTGHKYNYLHIDVQKPLSDFLSK
jgi:abhydrolase domain-containing protein 12